MKKRIAILGSTGSIGTQALEVIKEQKELFSVEVLTAFNNYQLLIRQAIEHQPNAVVIGNQNYYHEISEALNSFDIHVYAGKEAINQIYNVAVGGRTALNELFGMIKESLTEYDDNIKSIIPTYGPSRSGDVRYSQADISKAKRLLGYDPSHDVNRGMTETVIWFVKNTGAC